MGDHLIVFHSAVRELPGYNRHDVPSMWLDGSSMDRSSEHGRAVTEQLTRPHGTIAEAIASGSAGLSAAGITKGIRRQAREACEDYFYRELGLTPEHVLEPRDPDAEVPTLELMPEPMYRVLENIVGLVVDGEYEELHILSENRLAVEDLHRRLEEDCPESLVMPMRGDYRIEAVSKSDDPGRPGWAYFLDLWTEHGPARLHIEGELDGGDDRYTATLNDILP